MQENRMVHRWARVLALGLVIVAVCGCTRGATKARHLSRGDRYFGKGDYGAAAIEYANALRLDPTNHVAIRQLGLSYYGARNLRQAYPLLVKAREGEPDNLELRMKLGGLYLVTGNANDARREVEYVLGREPGNFEALMMWAASCCNPKMADEGIRRLKSLESQFGTRSRFHLAMGSLLLQKKDVAGAGRSFDKAVQVDPKSGEAHVALADFLMLKGEVDPAGRAYQAAAEAAPTNSAIRLKLADYRLRTGKVDEGRKILEGITSSTPDYLPAWYTLAELAFAKGELDECSRIVERILKAEPEYLQAILLRGRVKILKGKAKEVAEEYRKLLAAYPRATQVRIQLAAALVADGDSRKGIEEMKTAVGYEPENLDAQYLLAELYLRTGTPDPVIETMRTLVERDPSQLRARVMLGNAYRMRGAPESAVTEFRKVVEMAPNNPQALNLLGMALNQMGRPEEAVRCFTSALELAPSFYDPLIQLVGIDLAARHPDAARARVLKHIEKQADAAPLRYLLGNIHMSQKEWPQAEAAFQKAIDIDASYLGAYIALSYCLAASNRDDDALEKLEKGLQVNPKDVVGLMMAGMLYQRKEQWAKAAERFETILQVNPKAAGAANNLAYIYSEYLGKRAKGFELAKRARELAPSDPFVADTLGWIALQSGDAKWALTLLQESADKLADQEEVQYHLGMTHAALGDEEAARQALGRALSATAKFPGRERAEEMLSILRLDAESASEADRAKLDALLAQSPNSVPLLVRSAAACRKAGDDSKARELYEKAISVNPQYVPAVVALAEIRLESGDAAGALTLAKQAREARPGDSRIAGLLGWAAYRSGDYKWAAGLLGESVSAAPTNATVRYRLALARFMVGDVAGAEQTVRAALAMSGAFPDRAKASRLAAMISVLSGAPSGGRGEVDSVLAADPQDAAALMASARLYERDDGQPEKAKAIYRDLVSRLPGFAPAARNLAAILADQRRDPEEAFKLAMKARDAMPTDAAAAAVLGRIVYGRGEHDWAVRLLEESAKTLGSDPRVRFYLGMARLKGGDRDGARRELKAALAGAAQFPEAEEARKALAELSK